MSEKASAVPAKAARSNGFAMAALAFLVVAIILAAAATGPYIFNGATLEGEVAAQLRASTGLQMVSSGRASFSLLPSPRLELTDLHLEGPDRALVVDAGALEGDVRLLPLIVGRLELSAATLVQAKLSIDLDAGEMPADSVIGRALHGLAPPTGDDGRAARHGHPRRGDRPSSIPRRLPHPAQARPRSTSPSTGPTSTRRRRSRAP